MFGDGQGLGSDSAVAGYVMVKTTLVWTSWAVTALLLGDSAMSGLCGGVDYPGMD
jgi:hypothetical protein